MAKESTIRRNIAIYNDLRGGHSMESISSKYGITIDHAKKIDQHERKARGELFAPGRPLKKAPLKAARPIVSKPAKAKPAAKPAKKEGFVSGRDYVLHHVKRRLPDGDYNIIGKCSVDPKDVKTFMGMGIPETKATFLANFMSREVTITTYSDEYDYTLAIGYREDLKALVIAYARPDYAAEDFDLMPRKGLMKHIRKMGFGIASGRIKKAIHEKLVLSDAETASGMNLHIIGSMAPQVKKAFKFFKDKQINSVYMFTPAGRLALLESKE